MNVRAEGNADQQRVSRAASAETADNVLATDSSDTTSIFGSLSRFLEQGL